MMPRAPQPAAAGSQSDRSPCQAVPSYGTERACLLRRSRAIAQPVEAMKADGASEGIPGLALVELLSEIENGKKEGSVRTLAALARALGLDLDDLVWS